MTMEAEKIFFSSVEKYMDSAGFEPAASALRRQRSYQLSYEPSLAHELNQYKGSVTVS